jgi:hypothetical protein
MEKLMLQIESYEFAALLNIASDFKVFWRAAYREEVTKELIQQLLDSPKNIWLVFKRTVDLSQQEIDPQYENPWDTALAVYLWALSMVNLEVAQTAAGFVINTENGWWAKKFANTLLQKTKYINVVNSEKNITQFSSVKQLLTSQKSNEEIIFEKPAQPLEKRKIAQQPALKWDVKGSKGVVSVVNIPPSRVKYVT